MSGSQIAKTAQEHLARAKAYLNKDRVAEAVAEAAEGVKLGLDRRVMGRDKIMLQTYVNEFLHGLSKDSAVKQHFYSHNIYSTDHYKLQPGKERDTLRMLQVLHSWMGGEEQKKAQQAEEEKQEGPRELLDKGARLLEAGDDTKGRVALRKAVARRPADKDIPAQAAQVFLDHNMLREAADVCRKAMEANPSNGMMYSLAVQAHVKAGDYAQAEEVYKQALKRFGAHPRTYLNLAKLYLQWRKWSECYEAARQAAGGDPEVRREAEEIIEKVSPRIFASR
jgi:tetratricopeptide (TPR) repeat protein